MQESKPVLGDAPFTALLTLCILGQPLLFLPLPGGLVAFGITGMLALLLLLVCARLSDNPPTDRPSRTIAFLLGGILGALALRELSCFVCRTVLPGASRFFVALPLLLLARWLASAPPRAAGKLATPLFLFTIIVVSLLFVLSLPQLDWTRITLWDNTHQLWTQSVLPFFALGYGTALLLAFGTERQSSQAAPPRGCWLIGFAIATGCMALAAVQTRSSLGDMALGLPNPYAAAVGLLSGSVQLIRLEGLAWFLFVAVALMRLTLALRPLCRHEVGRSAVIGRGCRAAVMAGMLAVTAAPSAGFEAFRHVLWYGVLLLEGLLVLRGLRPAPTARHTPVR